MAHVPSRPMTGPFFHLRGSDGSIYVFSPEKKNARLGNGKRRRLRRKAEEVGVHIEFKREQTIDGFIVLRLSDRVAHGQKPKKSQQGPFDRRAQRVMGLIGVVYEPKPRTAAA